MTEDTRYDTETVREVRDNKEGVKLVVCPDRDGLGSVEVCTTDPKSEEWWGKLALHLSPRLAKKVAAAINTLADELLAKEAGTK